MNKTILKKYKPKVLEDINIDDDMKKIINLYLKNNKLYFLINGNSTIGKTSLINILLNEYYKNTNIIDNIIHINLLKEQGINFYRNELKNYCQINNLYTKIKKTIIIDDIDYLNVQSQQLFNSLINNYENINFIISCNNLNKIDNNFFQKLELIKINNTTNDFLYKILNKILKEEKLEIDDNNKTKIIKSSNYCIPNMINILEKISIINNNDNIDELVCNILTNDINKYINYCKENKYEEAILELDKMYNNGYSVIDILDEIMIYIKMDNDLKDENKYKIIKIICKYINIFNNIHEDNIELLFLTNNIMEILLL